MLIVLFLDGDGDATSGPFLKDELLALQGLEAIAEKAEVEDAVQQPATEPTAVPSSSETAAPERKTDKKNTKPKWFKLWYCSLFKVWLSL